MRAKVEGSGTVGLESGSMVRVPGMGGYSMTGWYSPLKVPVRKVGALTGPVKRAGRPEICRKALAGGMGADKFP